MPTLKTPLFLLLLTGCSSMPDGPVRTVEWRKFDDQVTLNAACNTSTSRAGLMRMSTPVYGCVRREAQTCVILTMRKTDDDTLGHELRHCFVGAFH